MAAFDHVRDLNDVALKPRLLHSLLKEDVPDEKRPLRNPSELNYIVSILKIHGLLYESSPNSATWTAALDSWVQRIGVLARCNLPDKCWAGVCLLGVSISECSSERFSTLYSDWFNVLLPYIQQSGVSQPVKIASCAAMSDLLTRLGAFPNLKKEGNSHAGKLVQPILKILNEDTSEPMLEVAAHLLSSIITYFPPSVARYYDSVEGVIVSKIISGNCSPDLMKKLVSCLTLLPRSRADEESWSVMMQKILFSLNSLLNDALEGLEEESVRDEAVALLVPPGKHPPLPLGGQLMAGELLKKGERSQQWLISTISSLMNCISTMLNCSYPVQVAVPICPILATVRRVLMVNGSLTESLQPFTTAMQQEFVCLHLPALQLCSLEVLSAVVQGLRCQLLPHVADIVRILVGCLKQCWLPEPRIKVYSIIKDLLNLMGAGLALYISQEVISNGIIDLRWTGHGSDEPSANDELRIQASLPRKRKHGSVTALPMEHHTSSFGTKLKASKEIPNSAALKIAAVETLEALLVVGGSLKSEGWRGRVDSLLIEVATNALRTSSTYDEKAFLPQKPKATWEDFQLVALHALLASILSSTGTRPPYLAQGLELFRKGKTRSGTKIAEFCAEALLALEVLVHPRALPFIDISLERADFGGEKYNSSLVDLKYRRSSSYGMPHDVYDFLNDVYLENNNSRSEVPPQAKHNKRVHFDENSVETAPRSQDLINQSSFTSPSSHIMTTSGPGPTPNDIRTEEADGDTMMGDDGNPPDSKASRGHDLSTVQEEAVPHVTVSGSLATERRGLQKEAPNTETTDFNGASVAHGGGHKTMASPADDEGSDPFPDIVDADPDTDSASE